MKVPISLLLPRTFIYSPAVLGVRIDALQLYARYFMKQKQLVFKSSLESIQVQSNLSYYSMS